MELQVELQAEQVELQAEQVELQVELQAELQAELQHEAVWRWRCGCCSDAAEADFSRLRPPVTAQRSIFMGILHTEGKP